MSSIVLVPDTNVLVAASTEIAGERHEFYDESMAMLSLLARHRVGFKVPKVSSECTNALEHSLAFIMRKMARRSNMPHAKIMEKHAEALITCQQQMNKFLSDLISKPNLIESRRHLGTVRRMSEYLRERYESLPEKTVRDIGRAEDGRFLQLQRFMAKYPNESDQIILAEVVTLKGLLEDSSDVMIASKDSGFFSPHVGRGIRSDVVTGEIRRRFGISCDHPGKIGDLVVARLG